MKSLSARSIARQRPKPVRTCRWLDPPTASAPGLVRLTVDRKTFDYGFAPFAPDRDMGAAAAAWQKPDGTVYHVLVCHDGQAQCDCPGFCRHHHCKHAAFTPVLLAGLLVPAGVELADALCPCGEPMLADVDGPVCPECTRWATAPLSVAIAA
jgi:hypothetical protein